MVAPKVTIILPQPLLILFPTAAPCVTLHAATLDEAVDRLDERWPGMRDRLCDSRPAIRRHINVFAEGRRIALTERLTADMEIFVMTAISGG